jgi:hypothetical protein
MLGNLFLLFAPHRVEARGYVTLAKLYRIHYVIPTHGHLFNGS